MVVTIECGDTIQRLKGQSATLDFVMGRAYLEVEPPLVMDREINIENETWKEVDAEREAIAGWHDERCDWHLNRARMLEAMPEARERDARALERSGDHYEQSRFHAESAHTIRSGEYVKGQA